MNLNSVASELLVRQNLVMGVGVRGKQKAERKQNGVQDRVELLRLTLHNLSPPQALPPTFSGSLLGTT